ncbi:MAG TPA: hypothetical protein VHI77_03410 [Solirubrobacterales bacterium]|jgi:hypothetical protein|nr:hypothetical protein [Solirubrobacterales bacterium]
MLKRVLTQLAIAVLVVAGLGGCGGGSSSGGSAEPKTSGSTAPAGASAHACALNAGGVEGLRATGLACGTAQRIGLAWRRSSACRPPAGASRAACAVRSYRCLATSTDRGLAVGCSRPGRSVAFTVRRR